MQVSISAALFQLEEYRITEKAWDKQLEFHDYFSQSRLWKERVREDITEECALGEGASSA